MMDQDVTFEDVERAERNIESQHGSLTAPMKKFLKLIKENLKVYEVTGSVLVRISDVMYRISSMDDRKEIEKELKYLSETFWD